MKHIKVRYVFGWTTEGRPSFLIRIHVLFPTGFSICRHEIIINCSNCIRLAVLDSRRKMKNSTGKAKKPGTHRHRFGQRQRTASRTSTSADDYCMHQRWTSSLCAYTRQLYRNRYVHESHNNVDIWKKVIIMLTGARTSFWVFRCFWMSPDWCSVDPSIRWS